MHVGRAGAAVREGVRRGRHAETDSVGARQRRDEAHLLFLHLQLLLELALFLQFGGREPVVARLGLVEGVGRSQLALERVRELAHAVVGVHEFEGGNGGGRRAV